MKIVGFEAGGALRLGVIEGSEVIDLQAVDPALPADLGAALGADDGDLAPLAALARRAGAAARRPLAGLDYALPVAHPGKILCLGLNYLDHVKEGPYAANLPKWPTLFLRVLGQRSAALRHAASEALRERDTMRSLAYTDSLTGLSNRRGMQMALQSALAQASPQRLVAVYLMDLDGFKPVNDTYGHDVGDDLLVAVGHRLEANVRQHTDLVARLGGDEFIVMARELATPQQAQELGQSLLHAFEQPFRLSHLSIQVGLTIGYALAPLDSDDAQHLVRLADAAMYAGKESGKHCIRRNPGELALTS